MGYRIVLLVLLVAAPLPATAVEPAPVAGDAGILRIIHASLDSQATAFPKGSMRATGKIENQTDGVLSYSNEFSYAFLWQGPNWYCDIEETKTLGRLQPAPVKLKASVIRTPKHQFIYRPDVPLFKIVPENPGYRAMAIDLVPAQWWLSPPSGLSFRKLFDPAVPLDDSMVSYDCSQDGDLLTVVKSVDRGSEHSEYVLTASLADGCNVTSYSMKWTAAGKSVMEYDGKNEWAALPDGRWYLSRSEYTERHTLRGPERSSIRLVEVHSFDATPVTILRSSFSSLELPRGPLLRGGCKNNGGGTGPC